MERKRDLILLAEICEQMVVQNETLQAKLAEVVAERDAARQQCVAFDAELSESRAIIEQYEIECNRLRSQLRSDSNHCDASDANCYMKLDEYANGVSKGFASFQFQISVWFLSGKLKMRQRRLSLTMLSLKNTCLSKSNQMLTLMVLSLVPLTTMHSTNRTRLLPTMKTGFSVTNNDSISNK